MRKQQGKIIIAAGINVWPHEMETARALAGAGLVVEFIRRSEQRYATSADVLVNGMVWEMKAPNGSSMKAVERNLRKACEQSANVIFDSRRLKGIPDAAVERELRACANGRIRQMKRLIFVNRHRAVIDIK